MPHGEVRIILFHSDYVIGHVGDGNFHVGILCDPNDEGMKKEISRLSDATAR